MKSRRKTVKNNDEDLMVGVVVLDVAGEPGWTGDGDNPFSPLLVSPMVSRDGATVGDAAAAFAAADAAAAA